MRQSGGRPGSIAMPPERLTYRQIAEDLAARIRSGEYPPGSRLPSYAELAKMYSVAVTTAQSAIRELRSMGLIRGRPGVGVFVAERPDA